MTEPKEPETKEPETWESLSRAAAQTFQLDADELKKEVQREMVSLIWSDLEYWSASGRRVL